MQSVDEMRKVGTLASTIARVYVKSHERGWSCPAKFSHGILWMSMENFNQQGDERFVLLTPSKASEGRLVCATWEREERVIGRDGCWSLDERVPRVVQQHGILL